MSFKCPICLILLVSFHLPALQLTVNVLWFSTLMGLERNEPLWLMPNHVPPTKTLFFVAVIQSLSQLWLFATPLTQHIRLLCPLLSPRVCSNSCSLNNWCYITISSSATPFSFCLQSFPASGSFPVSWLFTSGGQIIGALASVLPMSIQVFISFRTDWFDLLAIKGTLKSLL